MPQTAKILVVDDISFVRAVLRELLEKKGSYTVVGEAKDGEEAVALFLNHTPDLGDLPDIVLMDLIMPRIGGIEATQRILQIAPNTRIIILSGIDNREGISRALAAGAVDFIAKPVEPELLLSTIEHHLSAERAVEGERPDKREISVSLAFSFLSELLKHSISPLNEQIRQIVNGVKPELSVTEVNLQNFFNDLQERIATRFSHELAADLMQEAFQTFYAKYKQQIDSLEPFFPNALWRMGALKRITSGAKIPTISPHPDQAQLEPTTFWFVVYKLAKTGPEVVSAQEGSIPIKDELDLMGWHLKAGLVFLTALGQGDEYHQGLFGPFPVPASKEHSALVYAKILPDKEADDPRMPDRSYAVLGLFYPRVLETLLPTRDFLEDSVTNFLNEISDMSELDKKRLDILKGQLLVSSTPP
ncbi:MAG: response regulator [Candidatus Heimdallarchaeota archaeon]